MNSIRFSHFVADTKPNRPGTSIRAGKPRSSGSGWPFMPTTIMASRPSLTAWYGVEQVYPLSREYEKT